MTEKRFAFVIDNGEYTFYDLSENGEIMNMIDTEDMLNALHEENEQLKKDVEYWKQVASQYSNELNVFEHCKKYKTKCKDIYWSSD